MIQLVSMYEIIAIQSVLHSIAFFNVVVLIFITVVWLDQLKGVENHFFMI